ncbi:MAG TPA: hypothetical protein VG267_02345 [Terracidiphilus sp.]|jgi:hypothetical protein|nr:hypothetical protein [Terracidiphilus sp.]
MDSFVSKIVGGLMKGSLLEKLSYISNILAFLVVLPTMVATYYQAYKARQEAKRERESRLDSAQCLEFVSGDGTCINLVPLETLHSLPKPGDVVMLPAHGICGSSEFLPGAYLVESIEHFYSHVEGCKDGRPNEARLTKTVAQVTSLNPTLAPEAAEARARR